MANTCAKCKIFVWRCEPNAAQPNSAAATFRQNDDRIETYCGGPLIWWWQSCTSRAPKCEPHLFVKVRSASAPWLKHCGPQCEILQNLQVTDTKPCFPPPKMRSLCRLCTYFEGTSMWFWRYNPFQPPKWEHLHFSRPGRWDCDPYTAKIQRWNLHVRVGNYDPGRWDCDPWTAKVQPWNLHVSERLRPLDCKSTTLESACQWEITTLEGGITTLRLQ